MRIRLALVAFALLLLGVWMLFSSNRGSGTLAHARHETHITTQAALRRSTLPPVKPPPGMPLVTSYQSLSKLAHAGDNQAAICLFKNLGECLHVSRLETAFRAEIKDKHSFLNNPRGLRLSANEQTRDLDVIQKELDEIRHSDVLCKNLPNEFNDGRIYQAALRAALAGDTDATACLLMAPYDTTRPTPDQGQAYAAEVMQLADDGLHKGSWKVASAMRFIYSPWSVDGIGSHAGYQGFLKTPDPVKELQYSELIRLGTPGDTPEAAQLDRGLAIMRSAMSLAQQAVADRWAENTYVRYFLRSGFANPGASPCNY